MTLVSLAMPEESWTRDGLKREIKTLLAPLGAMWQFSAGETLLLYLGHLWPARPHLGVNPQPELLKALIEAAYEAGAARVQLAALAAPGFTFADCRHHSAYDALDSYGAEFFDLAELPRRDYQSKLNLARASFSLPTVLFSADCLVNVAKLRLSAGRMFGSAFGNLAAAAGLLTASGVCDEQPDYNRALVDLAGILLPDLQVVDALKGESDFQPQRRDVLMASSDALVLDLTLAAICGIPGQMIEELALAAQYGLGCSGPEQIHLVGQNIEELFK